MRQLNAHQQYLIEEFVDEYKERHMARRDLLRRVVLITGSIPFSASLLMAMGCGGDDADSTPTPAGTNTPGASPAATEAKSPTAAASASVAASPSAASSPAAGSPPGAVAANDPAIKGQDVTYKGPATDMKGYLAAPTAAGSYPGLLIIHENRGLNDHTKDVARRFAKQGYVALAVDLVSRDGGTKADVALNTGFLGRANPDDLIADLTASLDYIKAQPNYKAGLLGVIGYCFGGGYTWEMAISAKDVKAAIPYYGTVRRMDELGTTNAAILAVYGATDARVTAQAPTAEEKLKAAGKTYQVKIYPGAGHAFFNDTNANSYNAAAALEAWNDSLTWFKKYLV